MNVYVVEFDAHYDFSEMKKIFSSMESAIKYVEKCVKEDGCGYKKKYYRNITCWECADVTYSVYEMEVGE